MAAWQLLKHTPVLRLNPPRPSARLPQGYVDAARVFERESGTAPGVDLDQITDRMNIRKAVQSGDVEQVGRGGGGGPRPDP